MVARPITDDPDYTLCRDPGNPSDRGGFKESVYWYSVSIDRLLSCRLADPIGPGVNDRITVEVVEIGQDAAFEFVL